MSGDSDREEQLRRRFAELREEEARLAPPFETVLERARERRADGSRWSGWNRRAPGRPLAALAAAAAVVALVGVAVLWSGSMQRGVPAGEASRADGGWATDAGRAVPGGPEDDPAIDGWSSPTDSLLVADLDPGGALTVTDAVDPAVTFDFDDQGDPPMPLSIGEWTSPTDDLLRIDGARRRDGREP